MKFVVKLSVVVCALVFVLGVYTVTARAEVPAVEAPQELPVEKSSVLLSEPSNAAGLGRPDFSQGTPAAPQEEANVEGPATIEPGVPVRVSIPSILLNAPVIKVGTNAKGEMDVPDGATNNVGWYERGTLPGAAGSAVLDAHVYAAFTNLHKARVGDDIYIETEAGRLHFKISEAAVYKLADVPRETLFNRTGGTYLHLITCAGTFDAARDTYSHRLIVYATLAE